MRWLTFGWIGVFPLACGLAVFSFRVHQTLSGRYLGTSFDPALFTLALLLFGLTGWTTWRCLPIRRGRRPRRP